MSIFSFFRPAQKTPASQAKERLQIVMAHERAGRTGPDFLPMLQQELLAVIAKYVDLDDNKVEVKLDRGGDCSTLEVNIELPSPDQVRPKPGAIGLKPAPGIEADRKPAPTAAALKSAAGLIQDGGAKARD